MPENGVNRLLLLAGAFLLIMTSHAQVNAAEERKTSIM